MQLQQGQRILLQQITTKNSFAITIQGPSNMIITLLGLNDQKKVFDMGFFVHSELQPSSTDNVVKLIKTNDKMKLQIDLEKVGLHGIHEISIFVTSFDDEVQSLGQISLDVDKNAQYNTNFSTASKQATIVQLCNIYYNQDWKFNLQNKIYNQSFTEILTLFGCNVSSEGHVNTYPDQKSGPIIRNIKSLVEYKEETSIEEVEQCTFIFEDSNRQTTNKILCAMVNSEGYNVVEANKYFVFSGQTSVPGVQLTERDQKSIFRINRSLIDSSIAALVFYLYAEDGNTGMVESIDIQVKCNTSIYEGNFIGRLHGHKIHNIASLCILPLYHSKLVWLPKFQPHLNEDNTTEPGIKLITDDIQLVLQRPQETQKTQETQETQEDEDTSTNTIASSEETRSHQESRQEQHITDEEFQRPVDSSTIETSQTEEDQGETISVFGHITNLAEVCFSQDIKFDSIQVFSGDHEVLLKKRRSIHGDEYIEIKAENEVDNFQPSYTKFTFQLGRSS